MVARLSTDKDFLTLLKAMTLLNDDYHLVLVGDGELYQQIIDETHQLSLEKKVTLLGNRADVASIFSASTLSVLSSHAEGMGLTIIESLAVRTPCIGSDVEGIKDLLPNTYRFPKGNETSSSQAHSTSCTERNSPSALRLYHKQILYQNYDGCLSETLRT